MVCLKSLLIVILTLIGCASHAQAVFPDSQVMARAFPFLSALQADKASSSALAGSAKLQAIAQTHSQKIRAARQGCQPMPQCIVDDVMLDAGEISTARTEILELQAKNQLGRVWADTLQPSGVISLYQSLPPQEQMARAWADSAQGLNRILRVYALAEKPLYPEIDATSLDPSSQRAVGLLLETLAQPEFSSGDLFFSATYKFAEFLLYLDERENAGLFPQIDSNENGRAAAYAKQVNWSNYPYSAILILGDGPNVTGMRLGQFGKLRVLQAVRLFKDGKAPFIIVSGGYVHPARTQMNEALEMKRELMQRYGIDEKSIVLEPFARHTTTNFRNAVRLMTRYGIPLAKPALVTSSKFHIDYCLAASFGKRQMDELGYLSIHWGNRLDDTTLEFIGSSTSLHRNSMDPLDP